MKATISSLSYGFTFYLSNCHYLIRSTSVTSYSCTVRTYPNMYFRYESSYYGFFDIYGQTTRRSNNFGFGVAPYSSSYFSVMEVENAAKTITTYIMVSSKPFWRYIMWNFVAFSPKVTRSSVSEGGKTLESWFGRRVHHH